jgi:hypothetical protein
MFSTKIQVLMEFFVFPLRPHVMKRGVKDRTTERFVKQNNV